MQTNAEQKNRQIHHFSAENSTPTLKLPRRMILIIVLIGIIGFFSGVFVGLLLCQYCEKVVLQVGKYKIFGEHPIYCPLYDK